MDDTGAGENEDLVRLLDQVRTGIADLRSEFATRSELQRHAITNRDQMDALAREIRQQVNALERYVGAFEKLLEARIQNVRLELETLVDGKIDAKLQYELADAVAAENDRRRKGFMEWMRSNAKWLASLVMLLGSLIALYFTVKGLNEPASAAGDAAKTLGRIAN